MELNEFSKKFNISIKKKYKNVNITDYASILFYPDNNDYKNIDSIEKQTINSNYMFIALNRSKESGDVKSYSNFHSGRNDSRLQYISNKCKKINKCYITDFFKYVDKKGTPYINSNGNSVEKIINEPEGKLIFDLNFDIIKEEYKLLGKPKNIVLFGRTLENIIKSNPGKNNEVKNFFESAICITHYSYRSCGICSQKHDCLRCYLKSVKNNLKIK